MLTYLKFKWHRIFKRWLRMPGRWWRHGKAYFHYNVVAKWRQLALVRRFVMVWWGLVIVCLIGTVWQVRQLGVMSAVLQPLPGGSYVEGVAGAIKNINPIMPENAASSDATKLVFSGLTRFNTEGKLVPDLAESWTVSADGKTYTFKLRKNVKWHDDVPFSAQDVAFTLTAIQNPDTRSPLSSSWQGVTVDIVDDNTVNFKLAKPYTPFINATTVGILPRHLLEGIDPRTMRVAEFNQKPVGTGPYEFKSLDMQNGELVLSANDNYYRGKPLIDDITLRSYDNLEEAEQALKRRQVMGVGKVQLDNVDEVAGMGNVKLHEAGMPDQVAVFFNTTKGATTDKAVRSSLALATDRQAIVENQLKGYASVLSDPIVASGLDLKGGSKQAAYNLVAAKQALEAAGWKSGPDGIRTKNGERLTIEIVTQSQTIYSEVAKEIANQWREAGVEVKVKEVDASALQQSYIRPRNYSALLYGINVGADPDVYAYWHSSQGKDPGLNLSVYKSSAADLALESGRTVRDNKTRSAKYKAFNQAWVSDTPAVMLYAPSYVYGVNRNVYGIHIKRLITPSDRFDQVEKWSVRVKPVHINQ